jgi:trk system potassium uptake protein TrkH
LFGEQDQTLVKATRLAESLLEYTFSFMKPTKKPTAPRRWDLPRIAGRRTFSELTSSEMFVGSFVLLILLGTLGFLFLPGLYTDKPLGVVDAFFTATSAICVTGLIVVDTATYFTFWGQLYVAFLIQLGGLGILTFASMIIAAIGGRPSLRAGTAIEGDLKTLPDVPTRKLVIDIVKFTFLCEAIGAVALYLLWVPRHGWLDSVWPAIFHSVSAFCNAGFSTYTDSLISHSNSSLTLLVISILILVGGIGFVTLEELSLLVKSSGRRRRRLSVHTKLVLVGTVLLLVVPSPLFLLFEWNQTMASMTWGDKISHSIFFSITPRTAGYNAVDYAQVSDPTSLLTMILMTIGGAPGSTAGGMKITTFLLMLLLAWSKISGQASVNFMNRSIPDRTIQRATGMFVIMVSLTLFGIFLIHIFDPVIAFEEAFLVRAFEGVSAINTVGLSLGVTATLSPSSKIVLILMMIIGRVGPMAIVAAFEARFVKRTDYRLASEDVLIG